MRFIAFIPVFLFCALYLLSSDDNPFVSDLSNLLGYIVQNSLDFFFFISSFLLTSHALREYKYNKRFGLKAFYVRRVMRIAPLLIIAVIFAFILHPYIIKILDFEPITKPNISNYLLHFPNHHSGLTKEQFIYFSVIWTIFMLIQFYALWGFVLKFFKQYFVYISWGLILIGIVSRTLHILNETEFEFDILGSGIPVGIGALIANVVRNDERTIEMFKDLNMGTHILVYLIGTALILFGYLFIGDTYATALVPLITCSFYAYVVIEQTFGKNSFVKLRKSKLMGRLGRISYGMIIYQSLIMVIGIISIDSLNLDISSIPVQIGFIVVSLFLTWIAADVSYNFFERPIYSIKKEFKNS